MITKMVIYFLSFFLNIQVEMADAFRSDGKIYVVVLVALIILVGIFFYLFRIEGKIKDINKNK
jgi:predicted permease|tara:strand:- start:732 stop:920 length:189 start_codon:yes stop_codon:yes gene_type:complete